MITAITLSTFVIFALVILALVLGISFLSALDMGNSQDAHIEELRKLADIKRNFWNDEAAALEVESTIQKLLDK